MKTPKRRSPTNDTRPSAGYFHRFNFTRPLQTAAIFITFVIVMDFFVLALLAVR